MANEKKKIKPILIERVNASFFQLSRVSMQTLEKISDKFSFLPPGYKFNPRFRLMGVKGVKVRIVQMNGLFPAGLYKDVTEFIKKDLGKKYEITEEVQEHLFPLTDFFEQGITDDLFAEYQFDGNPVMLRDYQLGAVQAAFEHRYGLLNLSTGAGKCLGGSTLVKVKIPKEIAKKYADLIAGSRP